MEQLRRRYRTVEKCLVLRWKRLEAAQDEIERLSESLGLSGRGCDPTGIRGIGRVGDPTAGQAMRLAEARSRFERCRRWVRLGIELSLALGDSFEGRVFDGCLTEGIGITAMAKREDCHRNKVIRAKESVIQIAAIMAAERGLLSVPPEDDLSHRPLPAELATRPCGARLSPPKAGIDG